jgi:hypothetical protein
MALPANLRAQLRVVRDTEALTEAALTRLISPDFSLDEYRQRTEPLELDLRDVRAAKAALEEALQIENPGLVEDLQTAERHLLICLDRLNDASALQNVGAQIRAGMRSIDSVLDTADACWVQRQQRRHAVVAGGAPRAVNHLRRPDQATMAELEQILQDALRADALDTLIDRLADLSFFLAGRGFTGEPFSAWFVTRSVVSAYSLEPTAIKITGNLINGLQQTNRNNRDGWMQTFKAEVASPLSEAVFAGDVTTAIQGTKQATMRAVKDAPMRVALSQFAALPEAVPVAHHFEDAAWDDVATPPGSPGHL